MEYIERERVSAEESRVILKGYFVTNDSYNFERELNELIAKYQI
jgi:hypothetical protein